ncbi:hypothetical protein T492DRAFT_94806 [Pavlovales sp. CCMP2436]|nr:hypothetical protein T492DRAFT_94806 [Pavlovales sp. CCMP2436]
MSADTAAAATAAAAAAMAGADPAAIAAAASSAAAAVGVAVVCERNWSLVVLYVLVCVYLALSALQLRDGFPVQLQEKRLLQSTQLAPRLLFRAFLGVPFLWEVTALLDWTVVPTSLDLQQWFLLEDIYATLYLTQCRQEERRSLPAGARQALDSKLLLGATLLCGLLAVLLLPIVLFSAANPIASPNPLLAAFLEIGVRTAAGDDHSSSNFNGGLRADALYPLLATGRFKWAPVDASSVFGTEFDARRCASTGENCGYFSLCARARVCV